MKRIAALILAAALCCGCDPLDLVSTPEGPVGIPGVTVFI